MESEQRILIGLLSAMAFTERRDICRQTWMQDAPKYNVDIVFLIGDQSVTHSHRTCDELFLPCADDYQSLPQKTQQYMIWASSTGVRWVVKADDDTYICIPRLIERLKDESADYIGCEPGGGFVGYASGSCYVLSSRAVSIAAKAKWRRYGAEDVVMGQIMDSNGIRFHNEPLIVPWGLYPNRVPLKSNNLITTHAIRPELEQRRVFEICWRDLQ